MIFPTRRTARESGLIMSILTYESSVYQNRIQATSGEALIEYPTPGWYI